MISQVALIALVASIASAQTLNIPTRVGEIVSLPAPSNITGSEDFGNKEFDRGRPCDSDADTGSDSAVFILNDGASISNVIIGANALEGVHCLGSCTLTNVWFRDVCEDAVSVLGTGNALIVGGGAQEAKDKVVQHNGAGTVTIRDYTVVNAGKLYRSCGDCTNNEQKSPRNVIVENVRAFGLTSDLVGINSNFGDTAIISGSCGTTKKVCAEYKGVNKGSGSSSKLDTNANCGGDQGKLSVLPTCGGAQPTAAPVSTAKTSTTKAASTAKATSTKATTLATKTSTKTSAAATATKDSSSGTVQKWGQCGGSGYTGATACVSGATCTKQNAYYSQCL
ncbi:pectate lyase-domain-containing protein [Pyrenochaeta sp. MPI-SDFR-AT-0127]|nr:pectate lyase-domain-containing protein [Pyrenochaeta sp. MPI-SDFR-AT-0127]